MKEISWPLLGFLLRWTGSQFSLWRNFEGGVQTKMRQNINFPVWWTRLFRKGNPKSGLLAWIAIRDRGRRLGDHKMQAYNFRVCLTQVEENRIPFRNPKAMMQLNMNCC